MTSIDQRLRLHPNDRAGLLLTLAFGGLLAAQTWSGKGPSIAHVCLPTVATVEKLAPPPIETASVALEPATLDLETSAGALNVTGTVASEQDKEAILAAAQRNFSSGNIADHLSVDAAVSTLRAAGKTQALLDKLKSLDVPVRVRARGDDWTITGEVQDDETKSRLGEEIAALLQPEALVQNELTVRPAPPPAAPVEAAPPPPPPPAEGAASAEYVTQAAPPDGLVRHELPNGAAIDIVENGVESKVIQFIEDKSKPVDKGIWFDFDRLQFASASAMISENSMAQITAIGEILRAYPQAAIKIGGYTDNAGDPNANLVLSSERAKAVKAALIAQGIDESRIESEGYGAQYPAADNATEEGRAKNRRTAVSVRKK